jgi:hypothetical protein
MSQPHYDRMPTGDSTAAPTPTARILHAMSTLSTQRGQLYSGSARNLKDSILDYVYVGLPGDKSGDGESAGNGVWSRRYRPG